MKSTTTALIAPVGDRDPSLPFYVRSVGHYDVTKGWRYNSRRRTSDFVQFYWTQEGTGQILVGDDYIDVPEESVVFALPGERHYEEALSPVWRCRWFTLRGPSAAAIVQQFGFGRRPVAAGPTPEDLFLRLERDIHDVTLNRMREQTTVGWQILVAAASGSRSDQDDALTQRFFNLVARQYRQPACNVAEVCRQLGVHRTTLGRLLRRQTQTTPGEYLRRYRVGQALALLRGTDQPIQQVGDTVGIPDPCYFSRVIHDATGLSPRAYRRQFRGGIAG